MADDFWGGVTRFYNELVPWGDETKGLNSEEAKRSRMIAQYGEKTGLSPEEAAKEVDEFLTDRDAWIAKQK
ncbi:unnamed protein product, partial [Phaeothamnion confervicola]